MYYFTFPLFFSYKYFLIPIVISFAHVHSPMHKIILIICLLFISSVLCYC